MRDLSRTLGVPLRDVVKASMSLGYVRTVTAPLTGEEAELVEAALRLPPSPPTDPEGPNGTGVREPRRPLPPDVSAAAPAPAHDE